MEGNLNDLGLGRLFRKISVMEPMEERSAKPVGWAEALQKCTIIQHPKSPESHPQH